MELKTMQRILKICKTLIVVNVMVLFFLLGVGIGNGDITFIKVLRNEIKGDICNNQNLSLQETIRCLNQNFSSWFVYNISNIGKSMNESELKEQGGVCQHASEWYDSKISQTQYNSRTITFYNKDKTTGHMVTLTWDNDVNNYCIIDQHTYNCWRLG